MVACLSVVIPTRNAAATLPDTLACLVEGVLANLIAEVIITDGGSNDTTTVIAEDAGARIITGAPGRGGQLHRGACAAKTEWLYFLHADTLLNRGWSIAVQEHIDTYPAYAGYGQLRYRAHGLSPAIIAWGSNKRARWFGLPYGDQGLLISRDVYCAVGGYPHYPLMEDIAIAGALRKQKRLRRLAVQASTAADRYQGRWWRNAFFNISLLMRYFLGSDPEKLAKRYYGHK